MEKYDKKYSSRKPQKGKAGVLFKETWVFSEHMAGGAWIFTYVFYGIFILGIFLAIMILFTQDKGAEQTGYPILAMLVFSCWMFLVAQFLKWMQLYFANTMTLYYEDLMLVKKYVREDKKISYNELGESMRNKKIKIKKGQLNFHIMMVLQ